MSHASSQPFVSLAQAVIDNEAQAVLSLKSRIDHTFISACELILNCQGRTVVIGMGKSGHIGKKIAATLASTGTPAFFVHPGEANHGDSGMITPNDVVIAISNSGETPEILSLLPYLKRKSIPLIGITGNPDSTIADLAKANLNSQVTQEACPLGLAPTTSTTTALVMGDALAVALLEARGFTQNDFALFHPAGALGKKLLLHVSDLMHTKEAVPMVTLGTSVLNTLLEISSKKLGITTVVDSDKKLCGIYTDGDIRRTLDKYNEVHTVLIDDVMSPNPQTIAGSMLAIDALNIMQNKKITALVVKDTDNHPTGILHMHDLLRAGVI